VDDRLAGKCAKPVFTPDLMGFYEGLRGCPAAADADPRLFTTSRSDGSSSNPGLVGSILRGANDSYGNGFKIDVCQSLARNDKKRCGNMQNGNNLW